ncbi:hypothetical protein KI387_008195, partial [Taxus chinensis]
TKGWRAKGVRDLTLVACERDAPKGAEVNDAASRKGAPLARVLLTLQGSQMCQRDETVLSVAGVTDAPEEENRAELSKRG